MLYFDMQQVSLALSKIGQESYSYHCPRHKLAKFRGIQRQASNQCNFLHAVSIGMSVIRPSFRPSVPRWFVLRSVGNALLFWRFCRFGFLLLPKYFFITASAHSPPTPLGSHVSGLDSSCFAFASILQVIVKGIPLYFFRGICP